jgi:hypothetical protein
MALKVKACGICLLWSGEGKRLMCYGGGSVGKVGSELFFFAADSGRGMGSLKPAAPFRACAESADGRALATGLCAPWYLRERGMIELWDSRTGVRAGELHGHPRTINSLTFLADSKTLLSACARLVRLWDLKTGRVSFTYAPVRSGEGIFVSPEGHYKATDGIADEIVYVVEKDDGTQETLTPQEMADKYHWTNDPSRAVAR